MKVKVVPATKDDFPHVFNLLPQLWPDRNIDYQQVRVTYEHVLQTHEQEVLVAKNKNGVLVGMISFSIRHRMEYGGKVMKIDELVVDQEKRERSVGRQLLESAELQAIDRDCIAVRLSTAASKKDAKKFFHKMGYEVQDALRLEKVF